MSKNLVHLIGGVIAAGVLVLAVVAGVVPLVTGAFSIGDQTAQVASTNQAYQTQIARLQKAKQTLGDTQANVARLHAQIPAAADLDRVFDIIAKAAAASGAQVQGVTRGDAADFALPTAAPPSSATASAPVATPAPSAAPTPSASPAATAPTGTATTGTGSTGAGSTTTAASGRVQIPVAIDATAPDIARAIAFLDGLRVGPRLIGNVHTTITPDPNGVTIHVDALAYVEATAKGAAK